MDNWKNVYRTAERADWRLPLAAQGEGKKEAANLLLLGRLPFLGVELYQQYYIRDAETIQASRPDESELWFPNGPTFQKPPVPTIEREIDSVSTKTDGFCDGSYSYATPVGANSEQVARLACEACVGSAATCVTETWSGSMKPFSWGFDYEASNGTTHTHYFVFDSDELWSGIVNAIDPQNTEVYTFSRNDFGAAVNIRNSY